MKGTVYAIYRCYSEKEMRENKTLLTDIYMGTTRSVHFYGWSPNKYVAKAFMEQRTKGKYRIHELIEDDEILELSEGLGSPDEYLIDIVKLQSKNSADEIALFTTQDELRRAEQDVQRMFQDLCSLDGIKDSSGNDIPIVSLVNMIINLQPKYGAALHYIGYRPSAIDAIFDSVNDEYDEECFMRTSDIDRPDHTGWFNDIAKGTIYSLENIIKVLRDEL